MLRTYKFNIINNMYRNKARRKIYKFHQTVLYMVDRKRPLMSKFKWLHCERFGRGLVKVHFKNKNVWYSQKKFCLLGNLLKTRTALTSQLIFNTKIILQQKYELQD